ncbi:HEAT repeat domain-containing protein [Longispora urticae]
MLTGLDDINWTRLGHAPGSAGDVPDLIRALLAPDEKTRDEALGGLYGTIFHQGARFEATAHAVPFLLEVLAAQAPADQSTLLGLLAALTVGYDENWLPAGLTEAELWSDPAASAAYGAVRAGVPLYRDLLGSPDLGVRTMAAYLLAWFPDDAEDSLPPLVELVSPEEYEGVAATALVAIGLLGGTLDRPLDNRPVVGWAAAIAAARVRGDGADQSVADELLGWTRTGAGVRWEIPFLEGDLSGYAALALAQLGPAHVEATYDALLTRMPTVTGTETLPVLGEALRLAFPTGPLAEGVPATGLDERQVRLARVLAEHEGPWKIGEQTFGNVSMLVRSYGLPSDRESLRSFLGSV